VNGVEMIPLSALPVEFRGNLIIPRFLSFRDFKIVSSVIDLMESMVNQSGSNDYLKRLVESLIGDFRLSKALYYALKYFYDFEKRGLEEILGRDACRRLRIEDDWDLKKVFFKWVNEKYGFVSLKERDKIIGEFAGEYGIDPVKLRILLENELPENQVMVRKVETKPKPSLVIGLYNFLVLEKLLCISEEATLTVFSENVGKIAKETLLRAKRHEIIADFTQIKNGLSIRIVGPHQLFKLPAVSEYGRHIAAVISPIITTYETWRLRMTVIYRKKKKFCEVKGYGADSPILVPYWSIRKGEKPRETYDSSIEEKVYNSLRIPVTRNGWKILRESDIVILPKSKKIMIPDFTIKSDSSKVFIEVIGYWREKYLRKKREKLIEIANENLSNFIFLVNEKNRKFFEDVRVTKIYYSEDHIPIGKLFREIASALRKKC